MKKSIVTLLCLPLFACNSGTGPSGHQGSEKISETSVAAQDLHNKAGAVPSACALDSLLLLDNDQIPPYVKHIYSGGDLDFPRKRKQADAVLHNLVRPGNYKPFYVKAMANLYTNGYSLYYEKDPIFFSGLARYAHRYIRIHTCEFAACFDDPACFSRADLEAWADILLMELGRNAGKGTAVVTAFINEINEKSSGCTASQKETIRVYGSLIKEKWERHLKGRSDVR